MKPSEQIGPPEEHRDPIADIEAKREERAGRNSEAFRQSVLADATESEEDPPAAKPRRTQLFVLAGQQLNTSVLTGGIQSGLVTIKNGERLVSLDVKMGSNGLFAELVTEEP